MENNGLAYIGHDVPTHKDAHSVTVDPKTDDVWTVYADGDKSFILKLTATK